MSVETDPVPPVPEHTPPLKEDEHNPQIGKYFNHVWTRWFVSLREKINVLNSSLVTLGEVTGTGILVKNGAAWVLRTLTGTDDRVTVTDGDGASGNPTVDVVTADLVAGTNVTFTGSGVDRIIDNGSGDLTVNATGGGGSTNNPTLSLIDPMYDLLGKPPTSSGVTSNVSYAWIMAAVGTSGSITSINGGSTAPGVWRFASGTASHTNITLGNVANIVLGGGTLTFHFRFKVPILSDATNRYSVQIGLRDAWNAAANSAVVVQYTDNINSGNLTLRRYTAGVATDANSTVPVVADTWISGYIEVNDIGTEAYLYIGNILSATLTGLNSTDATLAGCSIYRTAGSTNRNLDVDYLGPPLITFTTSR